MEVLFSSISSVVSDRGSSEEDDTEYSSLIRPYQDEPLAGEDTESIKDQLDVDGLFPQTLQRKYCDYGFLVSVFPYCFIQ